MTTENEHYPFMLSNSSIITRNSVLSLVSEPCHVCWIEVHVLLTLQSLTDLENSRDDLLYELHKLPNQAPADKVMLKAYFEDVEVLSQLLEKQLRLVLSRTLNTVRKEPTVIVTALRIIEREEKADGFALQVSVSLFSAACLMMLII